MRCFKIDLLGPKSILYISSSDSNTIVGNSIVGDSKYNVIKNKNKNEKKLMLHASKIKFMINNKKFNFNAELPEYFNNYLNKKRLII